MTKGGIQSVSRAAKQDSSSLLEILEGTCWGLLRPTKAFFLECSGSCGEAGWKHWTFEHSMASRSNDHS